MKELPEIEDEKDDFFEDDLFAFAKENSAVQVAGKSAADGGEEIQGELF